MEMGLVPFTEKAIGAGLHNIQLPWRLVSVLLGAAISFMLQSGSAAVGVVIALTGSGLVPFDHGFHMVVGEVLGTTLIAAIATISGTIIARRAVFIYLLINISAILLVVIFPHAFKELVFYITPGSGDPNVTTLPPSPARLLANIHTIFSILTLVLFLPLLGFLVRSAKSILPGLQKGVEYDACCKFIDNRILNTLRWQCCRQGTNSTGWRKLPLRCTTTLSSSFSDLTPNVPSGYGTRRRLSIFCNGRSLGSW